MEGYPGSTSIPYLQALIPLHIQRIADLTESIGVSYFEFDPQQPYTEIRLVGSTTNQGIKIKINNQYADIRALHMEDLPTEKQETNCAKQRHAPQ